MVWVYRIQIDGVTRYIGITNNLKRREKEHNKLFRNDLKKFFYKKVREYHNEIEMTLEPICEFNNKLEASRMEAKLILDDYFRDRELWQAPPFSFKYF
jgi:predicted GIY-YIG superfamily endonuclease